MQTNTHEEIDFQNVPAVIQAKQYGESYAECIAETLEDHYRRGYHTKEYVLTADLGMLLAGNDGD